MPRNQLTKWVVVLCTLLSCISNGYATETIRVQLSWKYQFQFAAFITALEKGYYQRAGLDVTLLEGGTGISATDRVTQGHAEYGVYSSALILEYARGKPVVAIAALMQHSPVGILTDKTDIHTPLDLSGRTIAASPDTKDEVFSYLQALGLKPANIKVVDQTKHGLDNLQDFDALAIYVSNEGYLAQKSNKPMMMFTPRAAGIDLFGNILFTTPTRVKQHPEQVKAFRNATLQGLNYALQHPEEIAELIQARYNSQNKTTEQLLFEAEKIRELTRPDIVEPGYMSTGRWQHVREVYTNLGKLPRELELAPFIYDPTPHPDLRWLYGVLASLILILTAVSAAYWHNRRLTQQLREEITERLQIQAKLQASEQQFRELFEKNPDACWLLQQQRCMKANQAAANLFGYQNKEDMMGLHPADVAPTTQPDGQMSRDKANELMQQAMQAGMIRFEWWCQRKNGEIFPAEITLAKYHIGDQDVLQCIGYDITERKQVEKMKNEFISTVSHELRTPLTALVGSLTLVYNGVTGEIPPKSKELLQLGMNNANRLLLLINDILDISKIEAGKMQYQMARVEINDLVKQAVANNQLYGQKFNVHLVCQLAPEPLYCQADANRLMQVLNNLLSNAAKFSHTSGQVIAKTYCEDNQLVIAVQDFGKGIPLAHQSQIFKKFSQADSSDTRHRTGTGLGLHIANAMINAHQGQLSFCSKEGDGTTFFIHLPRLC